MSGPSTGEFSRKLNHWQRGVVRRMALDRAKRHGSVDLWAAGLDRFLPDDEYRRWLADINAISRVARASPTKVTIHLRRIRGELADALAAQPLPPLGPRSRVAPNLAE
jgi:hypothetical protein